MLIPGISVTNVLVAIDARRGLNNGHPSFLASLIDQLNIKDGETVYHVGCGTGYYSAIMAQMVGEDGRVVAVEVDKALAQRARQNLKCYRQVEVVNADGFFHNPGRVDAILVNAGVSHLSLVWLEVLSAKGRLVAPLTLKTWGRVLKATRDNQTGMPDLSRPWGSIPVLGREANPRKVALGKLLPVAVPRRFGHCVWMATNAIGIVGCMVEGFACRDDRHDNEVACMPYNPLLLRTGRQRRASFRVLMTRCRTER